MASCQGPVANGAKIGTGSTGSYDFTVTATDKAGNATSLTHVYTVAGGSCSLDTFWALLIALRRSLTPSR